MRVACSVLLVALVTACREKADTSPPDAAASPQATAVPAPLASPALASSAGTALDAGPAPTPIRGDVPLSSDQGQRESSGYALSAVLRQVDVMGPARAPETSTAGLEAARRKTESRLAIDATATRLRAVLQGTGWVLPEGTEVRARADRYGHVVVFPGASTYRPLAPGALRALFSERRFDVAPLAAGEVLVRDEPGKRIGIKVRKMEIVTRAARVALEVGRLEGLGEGGVLLCRVLLDLVGASPSTLACASDELPLRADIRWTTKGSLGFEVTGVLRRTDLPASLLAIPPPLHAFADAPPPTASVAPLLTVDELAALRTGAADGGEADGDRLVVSNPTDQLRMLFVDGVPAAWAAPGAKDDLHGLQRGRYVAQWRTFLGESVEPPVTLTVPGSAEPAPAAAKSPPR